jgi:hypothetical protein
MFLNKKLVDGKSLLARPNRLFLTALLMIAIIGPECWSRETRDLFSQIPQESRDRFVKRLNRLIQYQRTQRWEKMYSLLYSGIKREETIDQFSKRQQHWFKELPENRILDFVPHSLRPPANAATGEWIVFGCITRSEKGHQKNYQGMVSAYHENDDWFFSEPGTITGIDGPPTECESLNKKKGSDQRQRP